MSLIKQESNEMTEDYDESGVKTEPTEDVSTNEMKISQPLVILETSIQLKLK